MTPELNLLLGTALVLGITHTAIGIDHSLPFVLIARARGWSFTRTLGVTFVCGLAHVLSSVIVGMLGVGLVVALSSLAWFEESRGRWAAWLLIGFGVAYAVLSFWRMRRGLAHRHLHVHSDGTLHSHEHAHVAEIEHPGLGAVIHEHGHRSGIGSAPAASALAVPKFGLSNGRVAVALFMVFLVGPCEALLPLMTAPALNGSALASVLVAATFGVATVTTMLTLVAIGYVGLKTSWTERLDPHLNWLAGVAIAASGVGIQLLGF